LTFIDGVSIIDSRLPIFHISVMVMYLAYCFVPDNHIIVSTTQTAFSTLVETEF